MNRHSVADLAIVVVPALGAATGLALHGAPWWGWVLFAAMWMLFTVAGARMVIGASR